MFSLFYFFFFNDTATTEIYTLSLHDALPIFFPVSALRLARLRFRLDGAAREVALAVCEPQVLFAQFGVDHFDLHLAEGSVLDRKSTRLNSSHLVISYAVFCLKKKKLSTL